MGGRDKSIISSLFLLILTLTVNGHVDQDIVDSGMEVHLTKWQIKSLAKDFLSLRADDWIRTLKLKDQQFEGGALTLGSKAGIEQLKIFTFYVPEDDIEVTFKQPNRVAIRVRNIMAQLNFMWYYSAVYGTIENEGYGTYACFETEVVTEFAIELKNARLNLSLEHLDINIGQQEVLLDDSGSLSGTILNTLTSAIKSMVYTTQKSRILGKLKTSITKNLQKMPNHSEMPALNLILNFSSDSNPILTDDVIIFRIKLTLESQQLVA